jgi:hypothetical protein
LADFSIGLPHADRTHPANASCPSKKYSARMVGKFPRALIEQIGSFNAVRNGSSKM